MDTEDQVDSRAWIKGLFIENPNWVALQIHPIRRKSGKDDPRYRLGVKGSLISIIGNKKRYNYETIDWVATESKIRDIHYDGESNSIDEVGSMRDEENRTRILMRLEKKKRAAGDDLEYLDVKLKDRRLNDIHFVSKSTSTTSDNDQSRIKLLWILLSNKDLLISNGLMKSIVPVFKEKFKSDKSNLRQYVWINKSSIDVYGKESNLKHNSAIDKVDWQSTLSTFLSMVKSRGLELSMVGTPDVEMSIKQFQTADDDDREARHGIKSGLNEDRDENISIPDNDAKQILLDYYTQLANEHITIPFRMPPIVNSKTGIRPHTDYYFGQPTASRPFNIITIDDYNKKHKQVSGVALKGLMKNIQWMTTFTSLLDHFDELDAYLSNIDYEFPSNDKEAARVTAEKKLNEDRRNNLDHNLMVLNMAIIGTAQDIMRQSIGEYHDEDLQKLHDDAEASFQTYGEAQKRYEAAKLAVKGSNSKAARSALKATHSALIATKSVYQSKAKRYSDARPKLQGRGLRGAGVAPLEGVVRRGRTYNLNEIQGLATPSAYIYRQLGSKYIRLPDLDAKTLVLVQPNRRKCGPKCSISDSLQAMIKTLVYKQNIDQNDFDKLAIDDKKMFKEILAITHLQYHFHDKLEDPLQTLRAEYDKLKGELELGNDAPSIIKQLKSLTVDMYSNHLISDNEFRDIITRIL
ncbi:uncharacterized protein PHALS_03269 [Plasmopara halstedii]|uniref:Uncharacterized protein n=1 Tax=Plasmopara halstedii TaxID=4781 RepID=A0A0P1AKU3_PLAHL|nr:uncharacterized protein PHALS_12200 [Plasmopara halstedii]XP_024583031.1 uncharacterized protein PHALS_03269 [Plasmopara halstedii]CEG41886.1 hypothetical protein PHALS_12200 [Plasmopara halstedii]CEG46662.1 hypothetical protein PHALS_03269 [Plasmopara halstedii]|eukprot:XP_024578255.1 hypothetical protein PHALS_12200 [Plasmopara halstedii]